MSIIHQYGRHQMGTCSMGNNPDTSVVNGWGRSHIEGGEVSIPDTPGLGVIFDDDAMAAFRV
jgi:L-alanine-DL-glutamate epimerase-like enolase superfamily enzyme